MSRVDDRDLCFDSPLLARSLLTVLAASSLARFVEAPRFLALSLTCLYWRSRLLLHACCGICNPLVRVAQGGCPNARFLFQGWVLDVVLGRVLVDELVHDVRALAVCVVDLHERLPLLGQRVLREDRLDRALRFAGAAIFGVD